MTASPDRKQPPRGGPDDQPLRETYARLSAAVNAALSTAARRVGPMQRIEVPAPALDPLAWLAAQGRTPRLYWSERDRSRSIAGVGVADRLELEPHLAPADLMARVAGRLEGAAPGLRYYGGFRFDVDAPVAEPWDAFGRGWLVLPRFEWVQEDDRAKLACNVFPGLDSGHRVGAELARLARAPAPWSAVGRPRWRQDLPARDDWLALVDRVSRRAGLGHDYPAKLVLARRTSFAFDDEVEPLTLLHGARRSAGPCFHFCFDPGGGSGVFLGASPERLFHRRGREVTSEALAGTRPRGATPQEDASLRAELLRCAKEGREHASVVTHVADSLARLTEAVDRDRDISVVELAHVQHLNVRLGGRLREGVDDATLLAGLHPTPAVAGAPPREAMAHIAEMEPFDRGWYAGPVGYVGADETQFAVAIRSALVRGHRVDLYAGAGILEGSRPADEWHELESKMSGMQSVWAHG